jgi:hypothetical protein
MHFFFYGSPKVWPTSSIFQTHPKVNNHPRGGKSANLVTLFSIVTLLSRRKTAKVFDEPFR